MGAACTVAETIKSDSARPKWGALSDCQLSSPPADLPWRSTARDCPGPQAYPSPSSLLSPPGQQVQQGGAVAQVSVVAVMLVASTWPFPTPH